MQSTRVRSTGVFYGSLLFVWVFIFSIFGSLAVEFTNWTFFPIFFREVNSNHKDPKKYEIVRFAYEFIQKTKNKNKKEKWRKLVTVYNAIGGPPEASAPTGMPENCTKRELRKDGWKRNFTHVYEENSYNRRFFWLWVSIR